MMVPPELLGDALTAANHEIDRLNLLLARTTAQRNLFIDAWRELVEWAEKWKAAITVLEDENPLPPLDD